MTDGYDGVIQTLLLIFFITIKQLIVNGHIYLAVPPLYRV